MRQRKMKIICPDNPARNWQSQARTQVCLIPKHIPDTVLTDTWLPPHRATSFAAFHLEVTHFPHFSFYHYPSCSSSMESRLTSSRCLLLLLTIIAQIYSFTRSSSIDTHSLLSPAELVAMAISSVKHSIQACGLPRQGISYHCLGSFNSHVDDMYNSKTFDSLLPTNKFMLAPLSGSLCPRNGAASPSHVNLIIDLAEHFPTCLGYCSLLASFHSLCSLQSMATISQRH